MSPSPAPFVLLTASATRNQADGQDDQRRGDQEGAESCYHRPERASVGLPEPEMDKEAARLDHNPREQEAAGKPLDSVRVAGAVEVQEVDEREHQQHPGVGMPGPEKLLAELSEL